MLQVRHFEMQRQLIAQLMQHMQQRHRIRPTGNGDEDAVAGNK